MGQKGGQFLSSITIPAAKEKSVNHQTKGIIPVGLCKYR